MNHVNLAMFARPFRFVPIPRTEYKHEAEARNSVLILDRRKGSGTERHRHGVLYRNAQPSTAQRERNVLPLPYRTVSLKHTHTRANITLHSTQPFRISHFSFSFSFSSQLISSHLSYRDTDVTVI